MEPTLDSLELTQKLQQRKCCVPTIGLTADSQPDRILCTFRLVGAKDCLQRAFGLEELRSEGERALTEERLRRDRDRLRRDRDRLMHALKVAAACISGSR